MTAAERVPVAVVAMAIALLSGAAVVGHAQQERTEEQEQEVLALAGWG